MPTDKKQAVQNANYLWDTHSMYSSRPSIKVKCKTIDTSEKVTRVSCDLNDAVKLLYTDKKSKAPANCIYDVSAVKDIKFEIIKIGNRNYLADKGGTFKFLNKAGEMSKKDMLVLLKSIDSDYDVSLINDEICVEIDSPEMLLESYRNLLNVITKIKIENLRST